MADGARMPAAFLGHGNPMNALEENRYTQAWRDFGRRVPKPRAILVVSAHWYVNATAVTAMPTPRTIHDFYGFPPALFAMQYPAPGSPEVAEEVVDVVRPASVGLDGDSWGLDHGAWSVLVHAFPEADVPVVQLSLHAQQDHDFHFELAAKLGPLRDRGILIVGSGNIVHNLRAIDWSQPAAGDDWNRRFDDHAREVLTQKPQDAVRLREHPDFRRAHPTEEHFLPALYLAGLAAAEGRGAELLVDGYAYGSLSMASYALGCGAAGGGGATNEPSAPLPDPKKVPPENTNL